MSAPMPVDEWHERVLTGGHEGFPKRPNVSLCPHQVKQRDRAWTEFATFRVDASMYYNTLMYRYCRRYSFWNSAIWCDYYQSKVVHIVQRRLTKGY